MSDLPAGDTAPEGAGIGTHDVVLRDADEIEHFFLQATGMKPGYLQLSRGPADLGIQSVELAGVTLIWSRAQTRARWRDEMTGAGLHVGFAVESAGCMSARGQPISADMAQVWMPGKEMDLVMGGPALTLEVAVEPGLVEQLGWCFQGDPLRRVSGSHLGRLMRTCRRATQAARQGPAPAHASVGTAGTVLWRDQILDELEPVLAPWLEDADSDAVSRIASTPYYLLIRHADAIIDNLGFDGPFTIDTLARSTGVARRSLFHAYRKVLGVGPRQYFELRRLHRLRYLLRQAEDSEATVTGLATALGFADLGRLAASYRRQFGENPSDTLRRARGPRNTDH